MLLNSVDKSIIACYHQLNYASVHIFFLASHSGDPDFRKDLRRKVHATSTEVKESRDKILFQASFDRKVVLIDTGGMCNSQMNQLGNRVSRSLGILGNSN